MSEETRSPTGLRLGVLICDCGQEIAGRLDTEALRLQATALPGVIYAAREAYPCSPDGQTRLRQAIADHGLERVLIAGCTPRLVEKLFRQATGLDGCVEVVDIREQCAFVHAGDTKAALQKAADLIGMGVARLNAASLPQAHNTTLVRSALVLGGGLSGLAVALTLADEGIHVTLVEQAQALGGRPPLADDRARVVIAEHIAAISAHPRIETLLNARPADLRGRPGAYELRVLQGDQATTVAAGAIMVAADSAPKEFGTEHWRDRSRVKTQAEFQRELDDPSQAGSVSDHVMILCAEEAGGHRCSRLCCLAGIRQAIRVKQINPKANVTILFRDLYLGGAGDLQADELQRARELGVRFLRYSAHHPPMVGEKTVDLPDPVTGEAVHLPAERVVLATPWGPPNDAARLAALLRVPQDASGFLVEPRVRLRPGRFADDGIYVLGGAHQPVEATEALFQAYVASARVLRFLKQDALRVEAAVAEVDPTLCTGCANCAPVCPTAAISMQSRVIPSLIVEQTRGLPLLSLASVEALRCTGCGNCVVACPVKAIGLPGCDDTAVLAQISAALSQAQVQRRTNGTRLPPRVVMLACEWGAYAAADMAGARRVPYPAGVRLVRMPCSARFDPNHVLWAFLNGADGVILGACPKGECHYGQGNRYAADRVEALKQQLADHGIDPCRLRLEFLPSDDGPGFAQAITEFVGAIRESHGRGAK